MALSATVGSPATVRFGLYAADGSRRGGALDDLSTLLTLDGAVSGTSVTLAEVAGEAGEYYATFTPATAGVYYLRITDSETGADVVHEIDARVSEPQQVADLIAWTAAPS